MELGASDRTFLLKLLLGVHSVFKEKDALRVGTTRDMAVVEQLMHGVVRCRCLFQVKRFVGGMAAGCHLRDMNHPQRVHHVTLVVVAVAHARLGHHDRLPVLPVQVRLLWY